MINAAITARGLKKLYGRRAVLDQLDLTIEDGGAIGLLGANGVGKITLLKSLLGLIPVDAGRCALLGEPSQTLLPVVRARLGYVPQSPSQFPWLTGQAMLRYIAAFYPVFDWDYAKELAGRWKLALHSPIGVLSPGQQQRLSIVRALSTRPEVLILDEPIASLDPATRLAVIEEIISERSRRTLTVVFSSHLIGDLERLCSKFAIVANGKIAVMDEVQWFRSLTRVTLDGDENLLEQITVPSAALIRKSSERQRVIVLERSAVSHLRTSLPAQIAIRSDEPDLEAITTEWMQ